MANDPVVLLADEPTGELDEVTSARIMEPASPTRARGAAVLIVTHNPTVAATADPEISLLDGQVAP